MVEIPTMEDQLSDTSSGGRLASGDEQSGPTVAAVEPSAGCAAVQDPSDWPISES